MTLLDKDKETVVARVVEAHGVDVKEEVRHKNFSFLSCLGLAFAIINSWPAMSASLSVALPSGGPTAVVWGILVGGIGTLAMAVSLAEICHVYPCATGQAGWAAILAPPKYMRSIAWVAGWSSTAAWWVLGCAAGSFSGNFFTGVAAMCVPDYTPQRYQVFLVYAATCLVCGAMNRWTYRFLPYFDSFALWWSLIGGIVIMIVCLATADSYQPASFVFGELINSTGWSDGPAWILGLLQGVFGLTAFDAVTHLVEEMPKPHINAPKAMVACVLMGSSTSFIFMIALLFCVKDIDTVVTSPGGPLFGVIYQATSSLVGTVCLIAIPIVMFFMAGQAVFTTSARMTHAFARDGGLPFSKYFAAVNPRNGAPDHGLYITVMLAIVFGCTYIGSATALTAILSASVVLYQISYGIPIALLLFRGRHKLLHPAGFPEPTMLMGPIVGPCVNIFALIFIVFTTIFFLFPPYLPVTPVNMNYAIVVTGFVALVSIITWIVDGRKNYTGPRNLNSLLEMARADFAADEVEERSKISVV